MKSFFSLLFIFLTVHFGTAQTAKEIIQKHFEANGGVENWNQLNSIFMQGNVTLGLGETFELRIYHRRPYLKKVVFLVDGQEQLNEGFDGNQAYTYDVNQQKNIRLPDYTPDAFESDILNYEKKGFIATLEGEENVETEPCFKIKLQKNTVESFYWFRKRDYQLIQEFSNQEKSRFSEFKSVKGLVFPFRIVNTPMGGNEYVLNFQFIKPNEAFPAPTFVFD